MLKVRKDAALAYLVHLTVFFFFFFFFQMTSQLGAKASDLLRSEKMDAANTWSFLAHLYRGIGSTRMITEALFQRKEEFQFQFRFFVDWLTDEKLTAIREKVGR